MRSRRDYIVTKDEVYGYANQWLSCALRLEYEGTRCTGQHVASSSSDRGSAGGFHLRRLPGPGRCTVGPDDPQCAGRHLAWTVRVGAAV